MPRCYGSRAVRLNVVSQVEWKQRDQDACLKAIHKPGQDEGFYCRVPEAAQNARNQRDLFLSLLGWEVPFLLE